MEIFRSFMEIQRISGNLAATSRRRNVFHLRDIAMSRRCNIVMFQRCDIATSRRLVNKRKSERATQRCNVETFPRFLLQNYKKHGRPNFWDYLRSYGRGAENKATATREIEKTLFSYSSSQNY